MTDHKAFPVQIRRSGAGLSVLMKDVASAEFQDPFVEETIRRVSGKEHVVPLPPAACEAWSIDAVSPAGIIYHVSKCGSTLVSQLLKHAKQAVVYSQPNALDDILMPPHGVGEDETVKAIRALGMLFARHAGSPYVLKVTSWNALFCHLLKAAFPSTPWVFCIRDPIDVAVSVMEDPDPASWYKCRNVPGNPFPAHLNRPLPSGTNEGVYLATFFAEFCDAIERLGPEGGKIIAYQDLPSVIWEVIARHFGLTLTDSDIRAMIDAAGTYSKSGYGERRAFKADTAEKRKRVSDAIRCAAASIARPYFDRLVGQRQTPSV